MYFFLLIRRNIGDFLCFSFCFVWSFFPWPRGTRDHSSPNQASNLHPFLWKDGVPTAGPPGEPLSCLVLKKERQVKEAEMPFSAVALGGAD